MGMIVAEMVAGADFSYSINASSQLPFSKNESINIIGEANMSFIITHSANFTLPNITSIELNGTNNFTLKINISIPQNYNSFGNGSINETLFVFVKGNLTNGTLKTTNITFLLNIFNGTGISTVGDFVQLDLNVYQTTLCNYTLPTKKFLNVSVKGKLNTIIPIKCDSSLLECEKELNLTTDIKLTTLNVSIPKNTTIGTYDAFAHFLIDNTTFNNVSFKIEIIDCPAPLPSIPADVLERCKDKTEPEEVIRCLDELSKYFAEIGRLLREANRTNVVNVTIEKNVTVYEPVLPAGKELTDLLLVLNKTGQNYVKVSDDYLKAIDQIKVLEDEKNLLVLQLPGLVDQSVQNAYLKNENLTKQLEGSFVKSDIYYWLKWAGVISAGLLIISRYQELTPY